MGGSQDADYGHLITDSSLDTGTAGAPQIIWSKINWLIGAINLTPWYLTYSGSTVGECMLPVLL